MLKRQNNQNKLTRKRLAFRAYSQRGNTILEYAIVGALVLVVTIAILQVMSSDLNAAFAMIRDDMKSHQQIAVAAQASQKMASSGQITGLSASDQALLQQSLAQKLQTTGANGSTELLANQLASAAKALLQAGKIDQSQYDLLMQLSNQGHKIAQIEGLISNAVALSNGNIDAFNNMKFTLDGQTYTAAELSKMVGFEGPQPSTFNSADILTAGGSAESQMGSFLSLYNQALSSGALNDPLAKSTVDSASTQIASLGELTEDTTWNYTSGTISDPNVLNSLEVSNASQMNSSKICSAGKFQDNGALCSP